MSGEGPNNLQTSFQYRWNCSMDEAIVFDEIDINFIEERLTVDFQLKSTSKSRLLRHFIVPHWLPSLFFCPLPGCMTSDFAFALLAPNYQPSRYGHIFRTTRPPYIRLASEHTSQLQKIVSLHKFMTALWLYAPIARKVPPLLPIAVSAISWDAWRIPWTAGVPRIKMIAIQKSHVRRRSKYLKVRYWVFLT